MAIKKCKGCGCLFDMYSMPFCNKCMQEMDEKYKVVRDYLYENPNATVEQVNRDTETPEWIIMYFLREGRLSMANASGYLRCEQCGKAVTSGRVCPECAKRIGGKIQAAIPKSAPKPKAEPSGGKSSGMHIRS